MVISYSSFINNRSGYFRLLSFTEKMRTIFLFFLFISCTNKTSEYYFGQGKHYEAEGDYIQAIRNLTKAIEKNPQYIEAYQKRAHLNFSQDSFALAISDYTKIISLQPTKNNSEMIYSRGLSYYRSLQDSLACIDFNTACENLGLIKSCDAKRKFCK